MLRRREKKTTREGAARASRLALRLARDTEFRERFASGIEHLVRAALHTRQRRGLLGTAGALARDQELLDEFRAARHELERAFARAERKGRGHRLRNLLLLGSLGAFAAWPRLRQRIVAFVARACGSAGRRSQSPAQEVQEAGADPAPRRTLEEMTKDELYARAQELSIPGRSEMTKQQLIEALRRVEQQA